MRDRLFPIDGMPASALASFSIAACGRRCLVLGLPTGGVPVAYEDAKHLGAPLDVFVIRKLGIPNGEEVAMGRS